MRCITLQMFRYLLLFTLLGFAQAHYYVGTPCTQDSDCSRDLYGPGDDCGINHRCKCYTGWSGMRCLKHQRHTGLHSNKLKNNHTNCVDSIVSFSDMKLSPTEASECAPYVCTQEVFQCPDGSYVGRNNRNFCDFFPCPARPLQQCDSAESVAAAPEPSVYDATEAIGALRFGTNIEASMLYPDSGTSRYNPDIQLYAWESEKYTEEAVATFNTYSADYDCSWATIQPSNALVDDYVTTDGQVCHFNYTKQENVDSSEECKQYCDDDCAGFSYHSEWRQCRFAHYPDGCGPATYPGPTAYHHKNGSQVNAPYHFDACTAISDFASCQNKSFKLGPLVSIFQLPDWVESADSELTARARLNNYIQTVVTNYNDAEFIDVVEDAIWETTDTIKYRSSDQLWYSELQYNALNVPDYILQAFYAARTYAPNAKLGYVDYGLTNQSLKFSYVREMIQTMVDRTDPIKPDYVTMTDQLWVGWDALFSTFIGINNLGMLGVKTHLAPEGVVVHGQDVSDDTHLITTSYSRNGQAAVYATLLKSCLVNPYCESFEPMFADRRNPWTAHAPGIFDADYTEKTALEAIKATLSGSYIWIDEYMNNLGTPPTAAELNHIHGALRPTPECTTANICDARGCHSGQCHIRYLEVNPSNCADADANSMVSSSACEADDGGYQGENYFNLASIPKPKKKIGFGKPFAPNNKLSKGKLRNVEELHCQLDDYDGNGEHVLVEIAVQHGNYSDVGPNAFVASCNGIDSTGASAAVEDVTATIVHDWGYTETDKYVMRVDLEALPDACKSVSEENIEYYFQLEREGCVDTLNQQMKRFAVSLETHVEAQAKLGISNTPDVNIVITMYSGGTVEQTECPVVNADNMEYKYAGELHTEELSPNLLWAFDTENSDAISDYVCDSPPCLFGPNETIRVESKETYVEGSIARDQTFQISVYQLLEGQAEPVLVGTESVTKSLQVNCISGSAQAMNVINVHTEATPAVFYYDDDEESYVQCEGDECDTLDRDDEVALTLTLNQPMHESGLSIENIHWSLQEGLPSGDIVTVEDVMYRNSLSIGERCGKDSICGNCSFNDIEYSSRVDVWMGISLNDFVEELLEHNPNFYSTVVTIVFDIEASIGYCRTDSRRRLLSIYHLSHPTTPVNTVREQAKVGVRLGSEADWDPEHPDSHEHDITPIDHPTDPGHHHEHGHTHLREGAEQVSLSISGGTNILVLGMGILFLMSLCFLYALCRKTRPPIRRLVAQNRALVRTW